MRKLYGIVAANPEKAGEYWTLPRLERCTSQEISSPSVSALRRFRMRTAPRPADLLLPVPLRGRPERHHHGAAVGTLGADRHLRALRDHDHPDSQGKLTSIGDLPALPASGAPRPPGRSQP